MIYLPFLEQEALSIISLVYESFPKDTILLFSGGKDSCVVNHLTKRVIQKHRMVYPNLLTIDTGYNFPEVSEFLSKFPFLVTGFVENSIKAGTVPKRLPGESRNADQAVTLKEMINLIKPKAIICGARRDEDRARAKERVFSHRDSEGNWRPENQRMELYGFHTDLSLSMNEHFRVFPISNWTESDVWEYIDKYKVEIPNLYFSHERPGYSTKVRFRTLGDTLVTNPVPSEASTVQEIIDELRNSHISERGATRKDDSISMEDRKRHGYF